MQIDFFLIDVLPPLNNLVAYKLNGDAIPLKNSFRQMEKNLQSINKS